VPDAPRTVPQCPQAAAARRAADTLVWTAARVEIVLPPWTLHAGGWRPLPWPAGVHGRSAAGDRHVPCPAQGRRGRVRGGWRRPARTWPQSRRPADTAGVSSSADTAWVAGQFGAAGRHLRSGGVDSGRGLRTPATRRRPARWTPATAAGHTDTAAWIGGHCGSGLLDSRQRNRPLPLACPAGNGTARCGIGQHRHGQTARSVV
jgi:hypothetical protein